MTGEPHDSTGTGLKTPTLARRPVNVELFSTCPHSTGGEPADYPQRIAEVARWSEAAGCTGILVYTDHSLLDPWLVAQRIIAATTALCPLVAVQPVYMHPFSVAKIVTTLAHLYGRKVYLNMVAGGFINDLASLGDGTPHDRRYDRLTEYTLIIMQLLSGPSPVTYPGEFYTIDRVTLAPRLPGDLFPGVFVSGSSAAGLAAAQALGATAIQYPEPPRSLRPVADLPAKKNGVRIGIIARADSDEAWRVAHERFPEDRRGQLTHQLAMKTSDSQWHRHLSRATDDGSQGPYWLLPFRNYKTFCPYLVGSYEEVGRELAAYIGWGSTTFIVDIPRCERDLHDTRLAFQYALNLVNT